MPNVRQIFAQSDLKILTSDLKRGISRVYVISKEIRMTSQPSRI